jgi:serine/threonine protein kinase
VIVYDWVEGEPFEVMWGRLSPDGRAFIVTQIAGAVAALHILNVIHCDIAPRNIIVDSRLQATLIDFGLARRADADSHTRLAHDAFKAPEQIQENPQPCKASDVYALGVLLRGPKPFRDDPFERLWGKMVSKDVSSRPNVQEVVDELKKVVKFQPEIHDHMERVKVVVGKAPQWLVEDLQLMQLPAANAAAGFVPWDVHRAMEVAFFLNNVFTRIVKEQRGHAASELAVIQANGGGSRDELTLANIHHSLPPTGRRELLNWARSEVKASGQLRNAWAHNAKRSKFLGDARNTLNVAEPNASVRFREALVVVAGMLDGLILPEKPVFLDFIKFFCGR